MSEAITLATTIWDVVRSQAGRTPNATAVSASREYSYGELVESVSALSEEILALAPTGSLIALDAAGQASGVVGILAAAASGCAVLPLNRDSPPGHRAQILSDARPSLVLREQAECVFSIDECREADGHRRRCPDMGEVAYVLYTSGSTGRPKGVMVSHEDLIDRLAGLAVVPGLRAGESMIAMTALSFDISLAEMLLPLSVGASFITPPDDVKVDPLSFADFVDQCAPDVIQATPSFWRMLTVGEWAGNRTGRFWCGGEALTPNLARLLLPRCKELWNLYGPTEATIWATAAIVESAETISLGQPLDGTGLHLAPIEDREREEVPEVLTAPGAEGEIILHGTGLAIGYVDREDLTAERFPVHDSPNGSRRVYRTGDRARYRSDGSLEFLGRTDSQVKIRGHRIELGEIEALLEEHSDVSAAASLVSNSDQPERATITAFVAATGACEEDIQKWLAERLPASHCPGRIVVMPTLPRTSAGKVDRVLLTNE